MSPTRHPSTFRLLILAGGLVLITVLGRLYLQARSQSAFRVDAVGNLTFTFNGLPPQAPVFSISDLKPGDCYSRDVTTTNNGLKPAPIKVRANQINNLDNLASTLYLTITEAALELYGGGNAKSLQQFFTDSTVTLDGLYLSTLAPGYTTGYTFTVCMPITAGNEWQRTSLIFDLNFGLTVRPSPTTTPPSPTPTLPPECQVLEGQIQHVFVGTAGPNQIHGTVENDLIFGLGGHDILDASGGNDCVVGGDGNDYLDPEDGHDIVLGGNGNDKIKGGSGDDWLYGHDGDDLISGGTGNDHLYGGPGQDFLNGDSGDDQVYGEAGNDTLRGESGLDLLDGGPGLDNLNGGSDVDNCLNGEILSSC
ncbi:hypothetical protein A2W24_04265 [Microgenomates group bacterium RBG_16_45_19]|nr:MAG: hypothetical protein A2W24_04265 [Microgenomates group bacterium RBG_16_45_19]